MAGFAEIIVFFLAVWRLSKMVTEEEGPGMVFTMLRELAGAQIDGIPERWESLSWYGKLLQCPYCLSVWIALALWALHTQNKNAYHFVAFSLSGSAATVLIEDANNG